MGNKGYAGAGALVDTTSLEPRLDDPGLRIFDVDEDVTARSSPTAGSRALSHSWFVLHELLGISGREELRQIVDGIRVASRRARQERMKEVGAMADAFASGNWLVMQGKEKEFVDRWTEFLEWTRLSQSALIGAALIRDEGDPNHFVSFAQWTDADARKAWKNSEGFMERFSACRALCDDFHGSDYERIVTVERDDDQSGVVG